MADRPDIDGDAALRTAGEGANAAELKLWFVDEVLPLEAMLLQFLRRSIAGAADVEDIRQDVYMRLYQAARRQIPKPTKPLLFKIARDLLVDRARRQQIVSIEAIESIEALNFAIDEPAPDRTVIAREELRRLQIALDRLPARLRQAIIMRKIECLSTREIAMRLGIADKTVEKHLTEGVRALANILYRETTELRSNS
jgi:RNA polymerase sigma-70 factor (ECF subfamily)